jgi:hypothetical protein
LDKVFDVENFIGRARPPSDVDLDRVEAKLFQLPDRLFRPGYSDSHFKRD